MAKKPTNQLTEMQAAFLALINTEQKPVHASYIANKYYEAIGGRRPVASRDALGQTSAAYRTCRKLVALGLIEETPYKEHGYKSPRYQSLSNKNPL